MTLFCTSTCQSLHHSCHLSRLWLMMSESTLKIWCFFLPLQIPPTVENPQVFDEIKDILKLKGFLWFVVIQNVDRWKIHHWIYRVGILKVLWFLVHFVALLKTFDRSEISSFDSYDLLLRYFQYVSSRVRKLFGGNVGSCPQYGMDWRLHSKAEDRSPYGINCCEDSGFLSSFFFQA